MLLELGNVTTYNYQARGETKSALTNLSEHSDIAAFLSYQVGPIRVEVNENDIPYNFGDWYGIDHFGGYLASITENVTRVQESARARNMYGTNFQVSRNPRRPDQLEVFTGRSGLKVFENASALPRAWSVHQSISLPGPKQISAAMGEANFNPLQTVLLKDAAPALGSCRGADEEVQMPIHQPNYVRINVSLKCRGMVILTDTWFPGWHATVDGKPAQIHEAYGGVRGVIADGGEHMVEMRYRPMSVIAGFLMTLAAALVTGLVRWQSA
jgi:uncharacterized membrane protein YfhO